MTNSNYTISNYQYKQKDGIFTYKASLLYKGAWVTNIAGIGETSEQAKENLLEEARNLQDYYMSTIGE